MIMTRKHFQNYFLTKSYSEQIISSFTPGVSGKFENLKIWKFIKHQDTIFKECELVTFIYYIPVWNVKPAFYTIWLLFLSCENNEGWARICSQSKKWLSLCSSSSCKDATKVYNNMFVKHFYYHSQINCVFWSLDIAGIYKFTVKPIELLLQNTPRQSFVSSPPTPSTLPYYFMLLKGWRIPGTG